MNTTQCTHKNKKGVRCKAMTTGKLCHNHDPSRKEARQATGKRSRRKGSTFERDIANDLKPIFPEAKRAGLRQTQSGAEDAPDVDGCPPFWFEVKHGKLTNPRAALAQAEEAQKERVARGGNPDYYRWPLAVCKDDRKPAFVIMRWEHFKELVSEWQIGRIVIQDAQDDPTDGVS